MTDLTRPASKPLPQSSLVKVPRQRRSVEMVHAILDAAEKVLEEEGMAAFTTNHVAEVAGASIGSLYQYFSNKEMLVAGVFERGFLETTVIMGGQAAANLDAEPRELFVLLLTALAEELRPFRRLMSEVLQHTPIVQTTGMIPMIEARVGDLIRSWLLQHSDAWQVRHGPAGIWATTNAGVYLFLRWIADPFGGLDEDSFVAATSEVLASLFEAR